MSGGGETDDHRRTQANTGIESSNVFGGKIRPPRVSVDREKDIGYTQYIGTVHTSQV